MPSVCIPLATGVPNLSGAPGFIADPAGAPFKDRLDDPRWAGALGQGFPLAAASPLAASFRAVYFVENGEKSVYLSWRITGDTQVDTGGNGDVFYVGFRPAGASTATVLKIVPFGSATNIVNKAPEDILVNGSIDTYTNTGTGGAWVKLAADPAWVNANSRIWLQTAPVSYALQMKVPFNSFNLTDGFTMWYAIRTVLPAGPLTYHTWPNNQLPTVDAQLNDVFPDPVGWQQYGASPACVVGAGVGFSDYQDIGTQNTPTSLMRRFAPNTFYARPTNSTGAAIPTGTIKARFHIANWGSTYNDASWDDVPGLAVVSHNSAYPVGQPTALTTPITGVWTLSDADRDKYYGGNKTPHQCIYVTLSGAGVTFTKDSIYRNMDFEAASLINRKAEINIRGLAPIATVPRDVYILVQRINLPKVTVPNYNEGEFMTTTLNRLIEVNGGNPQKVERLQGVIRRLAGGSERAEQQSATQLNVLLSVLQEQLSQFPQKDGGERSLTQRLVSETGRWLTMVKRNKTASHNLVALLNAFGEWLAASAAGPLNLKIPALAAALVTWVGQLPTDAASQELLPEVITAFRTWLSNLVDSNGAVARLADVITAFEGWLNNRGSLPALINVIRLLSEWLFSLGRDGGRIQANFAGLIDEICEWLVPSRDKLDVLITTMQDAGLTSEDYIEVFPTCVYHVFHDTGRREKRADGTTVPILQAQAGFGLHAYHEGALEGWSAIIEGATRLADDFYVLKVPENGTAVVTTKVQAREPNEPPIPEPPIMVNPGKSCIQQIIDLLTGRR